MKVGVARAPEIHIGAGEFPSEDQNLRRSRSRADRKSSSELSGAPTSGAPKPEANAAARVHRASPPVKPAPIARIGGPAKVLRVTVP